MTRRPTAPVKPFCCGNAKLICDQTAPTWTRSSTRFGRESWICRSVWQQSVALFKWTLGAEIRN